MLIRQPQVRIISRPVTLVSGEAVLAFFALINVEGAIEVQFLGTKAVQSETKPQGAVLSLPEAIRHAFVFTLKAYFAAYVAPFFSTLLILNNQLARAPSLV